MDFDEFVSQATGGLRPYAYQRRLAEEGLPDLLRVPTGAGKTLAAVLPWLYRRRLHPRPEVRHATPRWLVLVLPQRGLVEQTLGVIAGCLEKLRLDDPKTEDAVALHLLMGGAARTDRRWKMHPADEAIFVGTQDMVLSRLLLRGFAEPRAAWPMSFGLLSAGVQFVFDETQLMGPGLPTALQLQGLRDRLGTASPVRTMLMSATVAADELRTADYAGPASVVELDTEDRQGHLRPRLEATRRVERADISPDAKSYARDLALDVRVRHTPETRTLVVLNTVARAQAVYDELLRSGSEPAPVLLHSRFRPGDRAAATDRAVAAPGPAGSIVVSTQVLEAGVDLSSRLLYTEAAPWSSIVQRAGRCNREGEYDATDPAVLRWTRPPVGRSSSAPYSVADVDSAMAALDALEGQAVTSSVLQDLDVAQERPVHPVLRRRDLLDLFDTAPDLGGNDLDVGRWIRDEDVAATLVAWRECNASGPREAHLPVREELCPATVTELREALTMKVVKGFRFDQIDGSWRSISARDIRPGVTVVLDAASGCYTPTRGWSPTSRTTVEALFVPPGESDAFERDVASGGCADWVPLLQHLEDVEREVGVVLESLGPLPGLTDAHLAGLTAAGRFHDLGKAHHVFVESLHQSVPGGSPPGGPWAKSPGTRIRHSRRYFRHELVSALLLLDPDLRMLDGVPEPDLVVYLVATHHGKVRVSVRPGDEQAGSVLGVRSGDRVEGLTALGPADQDEATLALDLVNLGDSVSGAPSWQTRSRELRDRADLGPFRIGLLEALLRSADWRASASYDQQVEVVAP